MEERHVDKVQYNDARQPGHAKPSSVDDESKCEGPDEQQPRERAKQPVCCKSVQHEVVCVMCC